MFLRRCATPVGHLYLVASDERLRAVVFADRWDVARRSFAGAVEGDNPLLRETERQLRAYLDGRLRRFDLPVAAPGTPFQERVWRALSDIPYGETRTYAEQARAIGAPGAVRAVGRANGLNPLCLVWPCHRVVGADGSLTGYAGGLAAKKAVLALEASTRGALA